LRNKKVPQETLPAAKKFVMRYLEASRRIAAKRQHTRPLMFT
jgi:hypothetical protein